MSAEQQAEEAARPQLAPHRRLHHDKARDSWTIQAPERVYVLDEPGYAIVSRCNGENTIAAIVDQLCAIYGDESREPISTDVRALLRDFANKGLMTW